MYYIIAPFILSLIISILLGKVLIPFLKSKKLGQKILDIGPRWHKSKEGTPLMGGLLFIAGTLAAILIFGFLLERTSENIAVLYTFAMAFCYGLIGFADDYAKLVKKQNEGLTAVQKLALMFPLAILYVILLRYSGIITTELFIPFVNINVDLGNFYYIFVVFGIVYIVNSVNLTDGVDGLCGSVTAIVMIMFIILFYTAGNNSGLLITSACLGGIIGYLYYKFYPAKVFMGDTGSFFLGGMVTGISIWLQIPLLLLIFGIVYIIESLSVMIQVTSFKLTGKRVFKMAPIHHHFEMSGWSEWKIVSAASGVTLAGAALTLLAVTIAA
jgi:phospho-N-acetylmuramoyl-pentapeptide-transferase